jgi:uncharacterized repeat protein (TIGR03803 family)
MWAEKRAARPRAVVSLLLAAAVTLGTHPCAAGQAPDFKIIFRFDTPFKTGDHSTATPVVDASGAMYVTTEGNNQLPRDLGAVVKLIPPTAGTTQWTSETLHLFSGGSDGYYPTAGLAIDAKGDVFGAVQGTECCQGAGYGLVFELIPPAAGQTAWVKRTLWDGFEDEIYAPLIVGKNGTLYGSITDDEFHDTSSIFSLTPPGDGVKGWTFNTLYTFQGGSDGAYPVAALIEDASGALYGTTEYGGSANMGTVFKLTPPSAGTGAWTEQQLYAFQGGTDGAMPEAPLAFGPNGSLYGTTYTGTINGGGLVFQLTPPANDALPWNEVPLCILSKQLGEGGAAGVYVGKGGRLYVPLAGGGKYSEGLADPAGTILKLIPPASEQGSWTPEVVHAFEDDNRYGGPNTPLGGLALGVNGLLYGTTLSGAAAGGGVVFSFAP